MGFFKWVIEKENEIKAFNDFISIIASFVAILLLCIAIYQIYIAAKNLKANTIYSIAKDGRELRTEITKMVKNNDFNYGYVFNYLHSVWHQKRFCTLDDRMWASIENEICQFLRDNPQANSYWNDDTRKLFDSKFVKYIERVGEKPECKDRKGGSP